MALTILDTSIGTAVVAARISDDGALRDWLDAGASPNEYDADGWTPLLAAAACGRATTVDLLLERGADSSLPHQRNGALPVHLAGQSGSVQVVKHLLASRPEHLDAVWEINGHTLLLQAVFYGHLELAKYALDLGADTAATTVRGLTAIDLARQFGNFEMADLIRPYESSREAKGSHYRDLIRRIAPTTPPDEEEAQSLSDQIVADIEDGLLRAADDPAAIDETIAAVGELLADDADVNRLGGALRQPPLVAAVTGTNGNPPNSDVADLRFRLAKLLLENGARPTERELHPIGVHAIIEAATYNHLPILKLMARFMTPEELRDALHEKSPVDGMTPLHDSVLRASTTSSSNVNGYLEQIRWCLGNGARTDIEDFAGRTPAMIADATEDPERAVTLIETLGAV